MLKKEMKYQNLPKTAINQDFTHYLIHTTLIVNMKILLKKNII